MARNGPWQGPLYRIGPRVMNRRLPEMIARYPDGRRFRVPAGDEMYAQVFWYGAYEPLESAMVAALLRPGDFAVDIGANHGWFSVLMANAVGSHGCVWAIEPMPPMLRELEANLRLNPELRVETHPIALAERDGQTVIHLFSGLVHGHASISTLGRDDFVEFEAEQRTLDGLLREHASSPALVKIDVEGAERAVLAGSAETLRAATPPIWMLEVNTATAAAFGYQPAELLVPFTEAGGYELFRIAPEGLVAEEDPAAAPHGAAWLSVPRARRERIFPLLASAS
jgi:FkbM family methyltransferase